MQGIELVKTLYDHFASGNYTVIRNLFHPGIQWNQMKGFPGGGSYTGADEIVEHVFDNFKKNWTHWKAHVTKMLQCEEHVLVYGYYEGQFKETGNYFNAAFLCEYVVEENKIIQFNQYTDTYLIAEAMGFAANSK